jgi:hypothetical protein
MKYAHIIAFGLVVIGGLNWLLVGAFGWDVGMIFGGQDAVVSRAIYVLVGLAAIYEVATHARNCRACGRASSSAPSASAASMQM